MEEPTISVDARLPEEPVPDEKKIAEMVIKFMGMSSKDLEKIINAEVKEMTKGCDLEWGVMKKLGEHYTVLTDTEIPKDKKEVVDKPLTKRFEASSEEEEDDAEDEPMKHKVLPDICDCDTEYQLSYDDLDSTDDWMTELRELQGKKAPCVCKKKCCSTECKSGLLKKT